MAPKNWYSASNDKYYRTISEFYSSLPAPADARFGGGALRYKVVTIGTSGTISPTKQKNSVSGE